MMRIGRRTLGVAFEECSASVAEVRWLRGERRVTRTARFVFPEGTTWDDPARLGRAFGLFLRQQRFTARRAVLGMPARWFMAREVVVPPADAATTASIVRLQAEREFSVDPDALVIDYADSGDSTQGRSVLLVAALRERVDRLAAAARAARLTPVAVTSDALALAALHGRELAGNELTVLVRRCSADLVVRATGHFCALRDVPLPACPRPEAAMSPDSGRLFLGELRRAISAVAARPGETPSAAVSLWDEAGLPADVLRDIAGEIGADLRVNGVSMSAEAEGIQPMAEGLSPAAALAAMTANGHAVPVDLLHSHCAPPARRTLGRRGRWAVAAGSAALIAVATLLLMWHSQRAEIAELTQRLAGMKKDIDAAGAVVDRVTRARGWYEERPRMLDGLLALTGAFPAEGGIWVTNLTIKPPSGSLRGTARDEKTVIDTIERLRKVPGISDVKLAYLREVGRNRREVSFAVTFTYVARD